MSQAEAAVVINPVAGAGRTAKRWPEIARVFKQEGLSFVHTFTEQAGEATDIVRRYLKEGHELIISVGGDGTNDEVINGFFHENRAVSENAAVGFISTGTGGDLARTIGIPRDIARAVRHIKTSPLRLADVGRVNIYNDRGIRETRYFINIAGIGVDAEIVSRVNRTNKALGGFISFLWGTVIGLILYRNKRMAISIDGKFICDDPLTTIVIGNGCYFGGGMHIAPQALMDDGLFDIIILRNFSKAELLLNLPRVYSGSHMSHPKIFFTRGKHVVVTSEEDALLNLDGEQIGRVPVEIELIPGAIKLKG